MTRRVAPRTLGGSSAIRSVARLKDGATEIIITSEEAVEFLIAFDPYWANDYRGSDGRPGEITKNKLAALLRNGYRLGPVGAPDQTVEQDA